MNSFAFSSTVSRRVTRSTNAVSRRNGSMQTPPFAPPKGTSTSAHLNVISAARPMTSFCVTIVLNRIPPLVGRRCWLCCAR